MKKNIITNANATTTILELELEDIIDEIIGNKCEGIATLYYDVAADRLVPEEIAEQADIYYVIELPYHFEWGEDLWGVPEYSRDWDIIEMALQAQREINEALAWYWARH